MPAEHQQLGIITADSDPVDSLDLDNLDGEIDFMQFFGCESQQLFHLENTYCASVPNLFEDRAGAITRPEHFWDLIRNEISEYHLYYNVRNCLPMSSHFATNPGMFGGVNSESDENIADRYHWLNDHIVDSFGPSRLRPGIILKLPGAGESLGNK